MSEKKRTHLSRFLPVIGKFLSILFGLAALALAIYWISGGFLSKISPGNSRMTSVDSTGKKLPRDSDQTSIVHEVNKDYVEESVGTLKAASRSVISSKILATIQDIRVSAGDYVGQGDVLVQLNTRELDARLQQAKEGLIAAQAAANEARTEAQRINRLFEAKAVSQRKRDEAERNLNVTQAEQRRAQQAVQEAEVLLSYATITAPRSGRIVDRTAEPGDTVQPGRPILTLYDSESLRLETPVLERLAVKLKIGDRLRVRIDSLEKEFAATIDEIVPQADTASRSFLVKASLPKNDNLYEGMYGRLLIPAGSRRHLCLDTRAIHRIGQLEFVDVVTSKGESQRRLIKTGRVGMPGKIEVLSGLEAGETVLLQAGSETTSVDENGELAPQPENARGSDE